MQEYFIEIWAEHEWCIISKSYKNSKKCDKILNYFAGVCIKDNKIALLTDISIDDSIIEELKNSKYFTQEALFTPRVYNEETLEWQEKESFKGSFINALTYIKKSFSVYRQSVTKYT